ncbi:aminotransferase class I/II-fold pyridoxal phosphate-dependent enzyme [Fournierella sp.]|uniref:aminotransferase class I/II-fold pyridoxal phosphate-dependent enzyme n=1 Tax=Allofournierella sp. TaxID=1940256 RepID=UPI0034220D2A
MFADNPNVAKGIIPLSVADMELKNAPEIQEGLKRYIDNSVLGYSNPTDAYLDAVIGFMKRHHDWDVKKEWIYQTPGVVSALFFAVKAYTDPGDGVIIMTPVYYPFYGAVTANGRVVVENPLIEDGDSYRIDFEDLERKAKDPKNKLILLCSPHNPVGRVWTPGGAGAHRTHLHRQRCADRIRRDSL